MRIGILTGGGDCPGLNAVIRAVTRRALDQQCEVTGVLHGWRGLIDGAYRPLSFADISGILPRGGTILKTSRTNPYTIENGVDRVLAGLAEMDALVAIGGEDTLGVAARLHAEHQAAIVGVPKTIDNDLSGTDSTFGFDTALSIATEAIDRLHSTAESHDRVMVCEVMGRHAGWIALRSGMAGGADVILIPEQPLTVERCCELIQRRHDRGKDFSIVVVSEGWQLQFESGDSRVVAGVDTDAFGHARLGGIGGLLAAEIEARTGFETRVTTLGHVQRGGSPTAHDRVLATRFGLKAADLVLEGKFGMMASLRGDEIVAVPIADAVAELKTVPSELYRQAEAFFG
jgi:ATP-dependent phosphofructokinase / diphosphate-dependent phosphofructokinase